ncbi:hypothetical protein HG536_0A09430 [Torulaspora globosa]|uniref:Uncharacterized protein n=1 Tax=Torulaspora globosa TaxID=48254 RepID=A0A7G3ZC90_9SACH|nr:uncharacterized protein HG536_0A09430 [Torulaspora globosa]QLL31126.1 hypothetical protein HG536_0A09430 [Torulaspora globosa]
MHRVRLKIGQFSRRWYGFRVRNDVFCPGNKSGGLILNTNQRGLARILWKYFNAPGNVMFVTMNIVTFAGIVTYSSLVSAHRERVLEERFYLTQGALEQETLWAREHQQNEQEICRIQGDETQDVTEDAAMDLEDATASSALPEYISSDISLPKAGKCDTYSSQMAKMSLFHMFYAYSLCKQVAFNSVGREDRSEQWTREVESLRKQQELHSGGRNTKMNTRAFTDTFYSSWRADFAEVFAGLTKSQQFHFPDWKHYPFDLRYICKTLYTGEMNTIEDFQNFYDSIDAWELKRLLRLWLYDYSHLIKPTTGKDKELFYQRLIQDCHNDNRLFCKYSSMLLDPASPCKNLFFRPCRAIPSASIKTVLDVLQEYISLNELRGIAHYDAIIRIVSMIRTDCVMSRSKSDPKSAQQVRILLPTDGDRAQLQAEVSQEERKKCFQLVKRNPQTVRLLTAIASWHKPSE